MGKTDDVLAVRRHESILAVLHRYVQVRAVVAVNSGTALDEQRQHRVSAGTEWIESARGTGLQIMQMAEKGQRNRVVHGQSRTAIDPLRFAPDELFDQSLVGMGGIAGGDGMTLVA